MADRIPHSLAAAPLLQVERLSHVYQGLGGSVTALRQVELELRPGERVAIMGRTGSGKTTLLGILAGLEKPTSGRVVVAGHDLTGLNRREREAFRRRVVGYVWQDAENGLLPGLSALENVILPMLGERGTAHRRRNLGLELLEGLRLGPAAGKRPGELTAAEVQRLAVAIALANRPLLLLADELTATLDWPAGGELMGDVMTLLQSTATAAVVVSHDQRVRRYVDEVVVIRDGVTGQPAAAALSVTGGRQGDAC
jgi:putative ABC transport system ATP-binding protein